MTALFGIFGLLLRKNWQVRKRHWILSLVVQTMLPVSIIFFARVAFDKASNWKKYNPEFDSVMNVSKLISEGNLKPHVVTYAPMNKFINELMLTLRDCWTEDLTLFGFPTEDDLNDFDTDFFMGSVAIIFNELTDYSTKHLHYKIRGYFDIRRLYEPPSLGFNNVLTDRNAVLLQIQICLDESFIKSKMNPTDLQAIPQIFIQRMPHLTHNERLLLNSYLNLIYAVLVITCFTIPLFIEMSTVANEKFQGIHILMSMNGVPSILNFFSWIISGLMHLCAICMIMVIFMFSHLSQDTYALKNYINPLILFAFFTFYNLHMMAFGVHISAYFTKPIQVAFAYLMSNMTAIAVYIFFLQDDYPYMVPYVGIMFPNTFLIQTMTNIVNYKESGTYIQWTNMFENSEPVLRIENSIGMILVFSILGMIFHFSLAIYVYATNPGKYGIGRHPLFLFMADCWEKNDISIENCNYDAANKELFELASDYTAGIQIRNLRKSYNVGLFNRQQVEALRGLSIDFYKGQITALLGHNGAGKSTLISILTGTIKPTSGIVLINSRILKNNASKIVRDVGLCAQEDIYFSSLTVTEQLEFFAKVKKRNQEDVKTLLRKLKLFNVKDALPDCLSADQRRKLCLAIAFVGDPSVLILDEPTLRLDYESKRLVWDILLEMKNGKTILVTTHDMHEADLLADRVAIMHEGRLKSYGSPLYLKQIFGGQNNIQVTLTIERWSDPDTIRKQIDCEAKIIEIQDKKIILSVSASSIKSKFLENLEKTKSELGVLSYSLSIASLEQVFLRVTRGTESSYEAINSNVVKLEGKSQFIQMIRALQFKNMTYALNESSTLFIQILMMFLALVMFFMPLSINVMHRDDKTIPITLGLYHNPYTLYTSVDKTIGEKYKWTCLRQGGNSIEITNASVYNEFMRRARENPVDYNKNLIAAAEFNETTDGYVVNALYFEEITHSLPISVNLVTNLIIKHMLGDNYSISLSKQEIPGLNALSGYFLDERRPIGFAGLFVIPFYFLIATFVIRPARESSRGLKHLQRITGVSGFAYWGTMFLSDMMQYTFLVSLLVIGFTCMDYSFRFRFFGAKEIVTMVLFLMLFAISSLPLVYMVSFIKARTNTLVKLVAFLYIGMGSVEIMIFELFISRKLKEPLLETLRIFHRRILFLVPHLSFFHAQIVFYTTGLQNFRCRNLSNRSLNMICKYKLDHCCKLNCYNGKCQMDLPYSNFKGASLDDCMQFLCMASVTYFCLLAILEGQLFQKIKLKFRIQDSVCFPVDQRMLREKSMIFQFIQSLGKRTSESETSETHPNSLKSTALITYGLCKRYKKIKAVEDVNFTIDREECFGILGANRGGKSVVLRIIAGEEVPDHGTIFMEDNHFRNNQKFFLSQIGYCRQEESLVKCLNSYDHLRLFARLRGVPEKFIENEVRLWIDRLNIGSCASLPTSVYSSGNKQRLNIAIALIGSPQLVVLDEPTIRVDPGARRSFWSIIKNCQAAGQTVLLASNNMEECEVLCNRMAVMVEGKLTWSGTPAELKQRFGAGYDVQIRMDPRKTNAQLEGIKNTMRLLLDSTLTNEYKSSLLYYVSGPGTTWQRLYDVLNKLRDKYECIDDYIVIVRLSN